MGRRKRIHREKVVAHRIKTESDAYVAAYVDRINADLHKKGQ